MKRILLTIFFFAAIGSAKCETPTIQKVKSDVKIAAPATHDATARTVLVGTNDLNLKLVREGVKAA